MKLLTLIVHTNVQEKLTEQLRSMKQISGFTLCHVEGHGTEVETDSHLSAHDAATGTAPGLRVEILVEDSNFDAVLAAVRSHESNISGQGIYWVSRVEQGGHLL